MCIRDRLKLSSISYILFIIKTCGSWIEKEKEYLKTLQNGINNKLEDVESTKKSKSNQQKYQELLADVNDLQSTVTLVKYD